MINHTREYRIAIASRWPLPGMELLNLRSSDRDTWPADLYRVFHVQAPNVQQAKADILDTLYRGYMKS